jgi:hypothetical protein
MLEPHADLTGSDFAAQQLALDRLSHQQSRVLWEHRSAIQPCSFWNICNFFSRGNFTYVLWIEASQVKPPHSIGFGFSVNA